MSKPGGSYPTGRSGLPDETELRCEVCGLEAGSCQCPECPKCRAAGDPRCYESHGLRYTQEESWSGRLYGVYLEMSERPVALFPREREAIEWANDQEAGEEISGGWIVLRCDAYLNVWNSTDPDPRADGFAHFRTDD